MKSASLARRTLVAAVAVLAVAGCSQAKGGAGASDGDMVLGKANAPVTVIEYASPSCPACAAFNESIYPEFKKKYVDTGRVRYVFREAPIHGAVDVAAFLMARCVGSNEKYIGVLDQLFRSQRDLASVTQREWLLNVGRSAGLTEDQFQKCVTDETQLKALNARWEKNGRADDITQTPTIIIDGKKVGGGGVPSMEQLDAAIAAAKKK